MMIVEARKTHNDSLSSFNLETAFMLERLRAVTILLRMSVCSNELVLKAFQRLGFVRDNSGNVALESQHPSLASQCVLRKEFLPHDKILENQPLAICM